MKGTIALPDDQRTKSIARDAATCRHFTGLFYKVCAAGISYESVSDEHSDRDDLAPYFRTAYPCLPQGGGRPECRSVCSKLDRPSIEEATREHDEREKRFAERMRKLSENICPDHNIAITKMQVGRCVYADPCGCRLYQGRA
jgi:hypothetical protein